MDKGTDLGRATVEQLSQGPRATVSGQLGVAGQISSRVA